MTSFAEEMKIEIPKQKSEGIRVFCLLDRIRPRNA